MWRLQHLLAKTTCSHYPAHIVGCVHAHRHGIGETYWHAYIYADTPTFTNMFKNTITYCYWRHIIHEVQLFKAYTIPWSGIATLRERGQQDKTEQDRPRMGSVVWRREISRWQKLIGTAILSTYQLLKHCSYKRSRTSILQEELQGLVGCYFFLLVKFSAKYMYYVQQSRSGVGN